MTDIQTQIERARQAQAESPEPNPIPAQSPVWDDRRNTSSVRPVAPNALRDALKACADFREKDPKLAAWIEAGHPMESEEDHVRWFGCAYKRDR